MTKPSCLTSRIRVAPATRFIWPNKFPAPLPSHRTAPGLGLTGAMTRFNVRSITATGIAKTRRIAGSIQLTTLWSGKLS